MFYRKDHNYIFVHNPKAAGRSIRAAIGYDEPLPSPVSHVPLYAIDDWEQYFTFGFVRNPWDRLVSYYSYLCQKPDSVDNENYDREQLKSFGFNKWITDSRMILFGDDHPDVKIGKMKSVQARSQMWWLTGCNFIGKVENLEEDLNAAAYWGGFEIKNPLKNLNLTVHKHYSKYYDQNSIGFVKKYFEEEIDRFGYTFK